MKIEINEDQIAIKIANILLPQMMEYQKLLMENKGQEDAFITIKEAMELMRFKSTKPIYARFEDGSLTKIKDNGRLLIKKSDVLKLIKSKEISKV